MSDQTTGAGAYQSAGVPYSGPVAGLTSEIILATSDNINVSAEVANVFIKTGSGEDALNVGAVNGNNVLDGSTGSNFLVGGTRATIRSSWMIGPRQLALGIMSVDSMQVTQRRSSG